MGSKESSERFGDFGGPIESALPPPAAKKTEAGANVLGRGPTDFLLDR